MSRRGWRLIRNDDDMVERHSIWDGSCSCSYHSLAHLAQRIWHVYTTMHNRLLCSFLVSRSRSLIFDWPLAHRCRSPQRIAPVIMCGTEISQHSESDERFNNSRSH